jgi:hypothetical protein
MNTLNDENRNKTFTDDFRSIGDPRKIYDSNIFSHPSEFDLLFENK